LINRELSYKISYMRKTTVSVRELQQNLKRVMARVERGQVIEVTRRRRPVARLALVPVYVPEQFSTAARLAVRRAAQIPFTALHQLEVPNAFELLVGRRAITRAECRAIQAHMREDLEAQRLMPVLLDLERVFIDAGEFSRLYTAKFLARSLDLLHVAAAHAVQCTTFVSADDRQLAVAKASGLEAVDIKRRVRRQKS